MWFDEIMDDCKRGLEIAYNNKKIFIPFLIKNLLNTMFFILLLVAVVLIFINYRRDLTGIFNSSDNFSMPIILILFVGLISYLFFTLISAIGEAGSIYLY